MVVETKANRGPDAYACGDSVLADQVTSGGERLITMLPCWDRSEEAAAHERYEQDRKLSEAKREQLASGQEPPAVPGAGAALAACKRIPTRELEHSPFAHRKEIAQVIAHRDGGEIRGVRILFKQVPGLTADWMRDAIACHHARFTLLSNRAVDLSIDPTLVDGARVSVLEHGHQVEVLVVTDTAATGQLAYDRAQDILRGQTATR